MAADRRRAARPPRIAPPAPATGDDPAIRPAAAGGTLASVRVVPRASRTGLDGRHGDALRVRLTAPPVEGAANAALIGFLASQLGLPKSAITLVSGATARQKVVHVQGLTPAEVRTRLGVAPSW